MLQPLPGYEILEKINESRSSLIYRGLPEGSSKTIIVKILKTKYPTPSELARFQQEYNLIKNLDLDGIIKTYDIVNYQDGYVLILEDFDGISLKRVMDVKRFDLSAFLKIAVQVARTLGDLHKEKIIHMDIKPHNILINLESGRVKITDFGISSVLTHVNDEIYNPAVIEEALLYISPEQTGRMNRTIDYRTDLYSLGVTFYEMLTGQAPFVSNDPMEIIHAHMAKMPVAPSALDDAIPAAVSDIIMVLLAKTAEDRYQNSFGLLADLQECLQSLERTGKVASFELARKDVSIRFNIPQKLYGREWEIGQLMAAFDRVSQGKKEIMMVSGNPGIGKSALINEIYKPIIAKRGYFISGKYDQFRRDVHYSAIIQAFQGLIRQILSESDDMIAAWKENLVTAFGPNGKIITDVIPVVELVTGVQPDVAELGLEESQNRYMLVFKKFIAVFCRADHPIVLFLDDLQWADSGSFKMLREIIADPELKYLFIIGAYRDNEVGETHQLNEVLKEARGNEVEIQTISLAPLSVQNVTVFISNFLRCDESASTGLAQIIHKKTGGNPFFVNQFLKTLYDRKHITIDTDLGWQWNIEEIKKLEVTANVVELMAAKISTLSPDIIDVLKVCASIGNRFDLETIAVIRNETIEATLRVLSIAIAEDLIYRKVDTYYFLHDRIQEAAYSLIPDEEKQHMHYRIGLHLLASTPEEEIQDKILYIIDHFNLALSLLSDEDEKIKITRLNLLAGRKAKKSAAYDSAYHYITAGLRLLIPDPFSPGNDDHTRNMWKNNYELLYNLYFEAVECSFLLRDYSRMETLATNILIYARTELDKAHVYRVQVLALAAQGQMKKSVEAGIRSVKKLGLKMPSDASKMDALISFISTRIILAVMNLNKQEKLRILSDPVIEIVFNIGSSTGPSLYMVRPELVLVGIHFIVKNALKYGINFEVLYLIITYGSVCIHMGLIDTGYHYARLAFDVMKQNKNIYQSASIYFVYNFLIAHWKHHLRSTLQDLQDACHRALDEGDFEFASLTIQAYCNHMLYAGFPLDEVENKVLQTLKMLKTIKHQTSIKLLNKNAQIVFNLRYCETDPCIFDGPYYIDEKIDKENKKFISPYPWMIMLSFLFEKYDLLLEQASAARKRLAALPGTIYISLYFFYTTLACCAIYKDASEKAKKLLWKRIMKGRKKMKKWAHHAPMNYLHKLHLINAEIARLRNKTQKALELYDAAIAGARENLYLQDEAIAHELAARFCLERDRDFVARAYMNEARLCYQKWGATAKVRQLDEKYPQWFASSGQAVSVSESLKNTTDSVTAGRIDMGTLKKSLKIIAEEKIHSRMIEKTIRAAIEFAGAQKGLLLLRKEKDKLYIEAEGSVDSEKVSILQSIPVGESDQLSLSVVNYVSRMKESVVIHNAQEPQEKLPQLESETYIKDHLVRSILSLPITVGLAGESELIGLLYLENNLATNIFTEERIETLEIICLSAAGRLELSQKAATDGLTGLYNHDYFQNMLQQEILLAQRHNRKLSLMMIDIDHFKDFNDKWGHQVGDIVLQEVSNTIRNSCRKTDIVARYGGEEIAIILPETNIAAALGVAEQLRQKIESLEVENKEKPLKVTISIGVSELQGDARERAILIRKADMAMYESKKNGRNRVSQIQSLVEEG